MKPFHSSCQLFATDPIHAIHCARKGVQCLYKTLTVCNESPWVPFINPSFVTFIESGKKATHTIPSKNVRIQKAIDTPERRATHAHRISLVEHTGTPNTCTKNESKTLWKTGFWLQVQRLLYQWQTAHC